MIEVTRRYHFSASHRLHLEDLSEAENTELYGKCNNPYGHGHDYILEVTCRGQIDPLSGLLLQHGALDQLVSDKVLNSVSSRNLNLDVPEFSTLVPTTENIATVIGGRLEGAWQERIGAGVQLTRVQLQETDRNGFELHLTDAHG